MEIIDTYRKIAIIEETLQEMRGIVSVVLERSDDGININDGSNGDAEKIYPQENKKLIACKKLIESNAPPGFLISGNLMRHLSFNMLGDWIDIYRFDIEKVFDDIKEYRKKLALVEYLNTLNPEISKVSPLVLNGEIEPALKAVYASLDTRVRTGLSLNSTESTYPAIGKAFKDGKLSAPDKTNNQAASTFLQGTLGYYRSNILHKPLSQNRNSIESSLSLFGLAHEAFNLFALCLK